MTDPHIPPPQPGARSAYIQSLISTINERTGGVYRHPLEPHFVQTAKGRKLLQVRPLVIEEGLIEHEWGESEYSYIKLLITRDGRLVRRIHSDNERKYIVITPGQLSDDEIRQLTVAICGKSGLTSPEYLRVFGEVATPALPERVATVVTALSELAKQTTQTDPLGDTAYWAILPGRMQPQSGRRWHHRMVRLGTYREVTPFQVQIWPVTHQLADPDRLYYIDRTGALYGTLLRRPDGALLTELLGPDLIEQLPSAELEHILAKIEELQPWLSGNTGS